MLIFAAHDPGAKNHVWPIFRYALELGKNAEFIDLSTRTELMEWNHASDFIDDKSVQMLITGCSTCEKGGGIDRYQLPSNGERPLIRACKEKQIPCISVVDRTIQGKLNKGNSREYSDRFIVTNSGCVDELLALGISLDSIILAGSAHLESYANMVLTSNNPDARCFYGLLPGTNLISFFCGPDTTSSIEAVTSISNLLPKTQLRDLTIIVRPHPRAPQKHLLDEQIRKLDHVLYDVEQELSTPSLLAASRLSLSMASTVSLESLVVGTPSAFYQIGWDYAELDTLYSNVDTIPRIRTREELEKFVDRLLSSDKQSVDENIEVHRGALARSWEAIVELT